MIPLPLVPVASAVREDGRVRPIARPIAVTLTPTLELHASTFGTAVPTERTAAEV